MEEDIQKTALRLPRELHNQVLDAAKKSGRSMNAEIVSRLRESFSPPLDGQIDSSVIEDKLRALSIKHVHLTHEWADLVMETEDVVRDGTEAAMDQRREEAMDLRSRYRELLRKRAAIELEMRGIESSIATYQAILSGKSLT